METSEVIEHLRNVQVKLAKSAQEVHPPYTLEGNKSMRETLELGIVLLKKGGGNSFVKYIWGCYASNNPDEFCEFIELLFQEFDIDDVEQLTLFLKKGE